MKRLNIILLDAMKMLRQIRFEPVDYPEIDVDEIEKETSNCKSYYKTRSRIRRL